ncbi:MAG: hypothetical protein WD771_00755 [Gemmatimonadaceae bacterium]
MSSVFRPTLLAAALLSLAAPLAAQTTPAEILARYTRTIDPDGRIAAIEGMKSTVTMEIPAAGMSANVTAYQRQPGHMAMLMSIPGLGEMKSGYNGTTAWSSDPMQGPRVMTGAEAAVIIDGANLRAMGRTPELFSAMEMAGEAEVDGEKALCVKLTWLSSRVTTECYSEVSGLMVETRTTQESPQGVIEAVGRYTDYRPVKGILIAHRITQSAMGMQQILTVVSVEFGPQDPVHFALPPEIRALVSP